MPGVKTRGDTCYF